MAYTKNILDEIITECNAILLNDYTKLNQRTHIKFRCSCGIETSKKFEMLKLYRLSYCKECTLEKKEKNKVSTCMTKYGVNNTGMLDEIKKKIKESNNKRFGGHPKKTKEVQDKWRKTCIERYGGHPNQNIEVQSNIEKNSYIHKDYLLPSGNIVRLQGYEHFALNDILKEYDEDDIVLGRKNIPRVGYICKDNINRIYYPDFYIKSINTIIEVKSEWTLKLASCRLEERSKATISKGYVYEVWVYSSKGERLKKLTF